MKYFKLIKSFDMQSLPKDIKQDMADYCSGYSNGYHVSFHIDEPDFIKNPNEYGPYVKKINNWLLANGAESGEKIYIHYWW